MTSGIYTITNRLNGHRYVGSSQDIKKRFRKHRENLRAGKHENTHLQRAWDKYGEINFEFIVLEVCSVENLIETEQKHIDAGCDYNIAIVAYSSFKGRKHTSEELEKMRIAKMNISEETREKLRVAGRKRQHTPEEKQKIREANTGVIFSEDRLRKMSMGNIGKKRTQESIDRTSSANRGSKRSEETKRKISEAGRRRWAEKRKFQECVWLLTALIWMIFQSQILTGILS